MTEAEAPAGRLSTVEVVGAGLLGTSVALALRAGGVDVHLRDTDPTALSLAVDLGAGRADAPDGEPQLVLVGVPPAAVAGVVLSALRRYPTAAVTDVASVKAHPVTEVTRTAAAAARRFVGGHPMAGRERRGPGAARADLFEGRPWVLTPTADADPEALARVRELVARCGADLVEMTPQRHDEAVALVSHAPQVLASLMAARLVAAPDDLVGLAGQGVRDVTRIAGSDPGLWTQILAANAEAVAPVLDAVARDLDELRTALAPDGSAGPLRDLLRRGNVGRGRLPGKHGGAPADYGVVQVVVPDRPGELARIFGVAGRAEVNLEDVRVEHSPGRQTGLVEIAVRPQVVPRLTEALAEAGFRVHVEAARG